MAHSAVTGHPIPAANTVVMIGLGTVEASLLALILRVKRGKVDSQLQYKFALVSIVIISTSMGANALAGVAVIQQSPIGALVGYVSYVSPLLPIAALMLTFATDAAGDSVQGKIRAAITAQKLQSSIDQQTIDAQDAAADTMRLELERDGAKRATDRARLSAEVEIAKAEAAVLATVATKAADVRRVQMLAYIESDEFQKNQARSAKSDTLALLKAATRPAFQSGNTPNV